MFLFGCFSNKDVDTPEDVTEASNGEITKVHFTYDNFSGNQFYLDVIVDKISEKGSDRIIIQAAKKKARSNLMPMKSRNYLISWEDTIWKLSPIIRHTV